MARLLSEFVGETLVRGPYQAGSAVAEDAVRRTIIDLCERGGIWQYEQEFELQYGVADYPLLAPENTRVVCVGWVDIQGRKFQATQGTYTCGCGFFSVTVPNAKTVLFQPAPYPTCPSSVKVNLWLAPLQECCAFPDIFYQEYSDTIADGAAARLLAQPKQDYTNFGLARQLMAQYQIGVTRAKNKRVMQHTTGPILMRGGYF